MPSYPEPTEEAAEYSSEYYQPPPPPAPEPGPRDSPAPGPPPGHLAEAPTDWLHPVDHHEPAYTDHYNWLPDNHYGYSEVSVRTIYYTGHHF